MIDQDDADRNLVQRAHAEEVRPDFDVMAGASDVLARGLYRSGPWLVVYGSGPDSEDAAIQISEQCDTRGVQNILHPIDEIAEVGLDYFPSLVVVLPSQLADPSAALRPFARLIVDYRARRPKGLESLLNGSCKWFEAGVVQVVGRRAIMHHPGIEAVLDRVSARRYTDESGLLDMFQPYTRRFTLVQQLDEQPASTVPDESIERLWRDVQAWGVADIEDVPKLRKCIDDFRDLYEDERFPNLYRPISNIPRNRLDIILDGPHNINAIGNRKTWIESGARVCRNVEKELKKIVPELTHPGGRYSTKDAQKQLRRLYDNLRIIESFMRGSNK
jgi:hypothetical protein